MKLQKMVLAAVAAALTLAVVCFCIGRGENTAAMAPVSGRTTLVIDAGHGGADGGASSANGIKESDINLQIALRLEQLSAFMGMEPVMTRTEDAHLGGETFKKSADIRARLALAEDHPGAILLSIHQNHFSDPKYGGAQVFYGAGNGSQELAETIQQQLRTALDPDNGRQAKSGVDSAYILKNYSGVSVLAECGFLSNPQDEAALQTDSYQIRAAMAMTAAVLTYQLP